MLRNMTLGNYYYSKSYIHLLNSKLKILLTLLYILLLIFGRGIYVIGGCFLFLAIVMIASKIPVKYIFKGTLSILVLTLILGAAIMLFRGNRVYLSGAIFNINDVYITVTIMLKIILFIFGISMLTFTTRFYELVEGFMFLLGFLKIFKLNTLKISVAIVVSIKILSIITEEYNCASEAIEARGGRGKDDRIILKLKHAPMIWRITYKNVVNKIKSISGEIQ